MLIVTLVLATLLVAAVCLILRLYVELYRWSTILKMGRIAVAYKNKVKLQAPLTELAAWARRLQEDDYANGQVFYRLGGTTIAIAKPRVEQNWLQRKLINASGKVSK